MSALGEKWSIVSFGISCQTSWQIRTNIELLKRLTSDPTLKVSTFIFDWLVCPPKGVQSMITARSFFPSRPDQVSVDFAPRWSEKNVYYWHDFPRNNVIGNYRSARDKYAHIRSKIHSLKQCPNVLAIISNTQNNLGWMARKTGLIDPILRPSDLASLKSAIERWLGRRIHMLVATYQCALFNQLSGTACVYRLQRDKSEWHGDHVQWAQVLTEFFSHVEPIIPSTPSPSLRVEQESPSPGLRSRSAG